MRKVYTTEQKRDLIQRGIEQNVTLDGNPAMISGAMLDFAMIRPLGKGQETSIAFAWATVETVLSNSNNFRSN